MAKTDLTTERLRSILHYNQDSGDFTWVNDAGRYGRYPRGSNAGGVNGKGYIAIKIGYKSYKAHHLAWLATYGEFPIDQVDHIDGNKSNNAICNLRLASTKQNTQNQHKAHSTNVSGFLGVSSRENGTYQARITVNHKTVSIGYFDSAALAHEAYLFEKKKLHEFGYISKTAPVTHPDKRSYLGRSKSGFVGVHFDKQSGKWIARPFINGKQINLGRFDSPEDAHKKCVDAKNGGH